jgi:RimJ/RimL family protein N-acetyltransferase
MPDIEEGAMSQFYFLRTRHLGIRRATIQDADFIHTLWTMPAVMRFVGFPEGLAISVNEVREGIERGPNSEFGSRLIVELRSTQVPIGQCKISTPDAAGICEPDIKLSPEVWGSGYGRELWAAMIDYAFQNSPADIVQGTPNRANIASVRMQLGSGMIQVDEGVFVNHSSPHPGAVPVPYFKLQITREQWLSLPR